MSTATLSHSARRVAMSSTRAERIPWHIWAAVTAAACIMTGLYWDISWHETIGRDTFWTPAHLVIQFGAVLAGFYSAYLIFSTTFGHNVAAKDASVNVLGFRGPLGAFISAWGGAAMLISAPFDNWWHNAYGLDVKIISPPHSLLALGIGGIMWGSVILLLGQMNRTEGALRRRLQRLLLCTGGFIIVQDMMFKLTTTNRVLTHSAVFYMTVSIGMGVMLEGIARSSGFRWARTAITGFYTVFFLLALWILPLFPAEPKLGPVYHHVTHMVSLHFPVLIIFPAFVLDLVFPKIKDWSKWTQAAVEGVLFVVVLLAVTWPFGTFLVESTASRNWFFGTQQFAYFLDPTLASVRNVFYVADATRTTFLLKMGIALVAGILSTRVGIAWGNWLARVRR
ncbi:MAG TPA: hypothetical protein VI636_25430 [Candidatus Angelobacter sp.]